MKARVLAGSGFDCRADRLRAAAMLKRRLARGNLELLRFEAGCGPSPALSENPASGHGQAGGGRAISGQLSSTCPGVESREVSFSTARRAEP